jgi:hypothetical protein
VPDRNEVVYGWVSSTVLWLHTSLPPTQDTRFAVALLKRGSSLSGRPSRNWLRCPLLLVFKGINSVKLSIFYSDESCPLNVSQAVFQARSSDLALYVDQNHHSTQSPLNKQHSLRDKGPMPPPVHYVSR